MNRTKSAVTLNHAHFQALLNMLKPAVPHKHR